MTIGEVIVLLENIIKDLIAALTAFFAQKEAEGEEAAE